MFLSNLVDMDVKHPQNLLFSNIIIEGKRVAFEQVHLYLGHLPGLDDRDISLGIIHLGLLAATLAIPLQFGLLAAALFILIQLDLLIIIIISLD